VPSALGIAGKVRSKIDAEGKSIGDNYAVALSEGMKGF
jgi:hypothetical protein